MITVLTILIFTSEMLSLIPDDKIKANSILELSKNLIQLMVHIIKKYT